MLVIIEEREERVSDVIMSSGLGWLNLMDQCVLPNGDVQ